MATEISSPSSVRVLIFFDFLAAFPSVAHAWIFHVLHAIGIPSWLVNIIHCIYTNAWAVSDDGGRWSPLFQFLSGVLQGCPASEFLFNLALNPFLIIFQEALEQHKGGIMRACADD